MLSVWVRSDLRLHLPCRVHARSTCSMYLIETPLRFCPLPQLQCGGASSTTTRSRRRWKPAVCRYARSFRSTVKSTRSLQSFGGY
ncbi:hypothetical protein ACG83_00105 [Frankia sp. R43]|nr:hypothetical protein ACG83_00105 [Frankia sp. R43]